MKIETKFELTQRIFEIRQEKLVRVNGKNVWKLPADKRKWHVCPPRFLTKITFVANAKCPQGYWFYEADGWRMQEDRMFLIREEAQAECDKRNGK